MDFVEEKAKKTIFKIWSKFRYEITSVIISILIIFISLGFFIKATVNKKKISFNQTTVNKTTEQKRIIVDLSGAVEKPGVYEIKNGDRLKDVLVMADGLSAAADRQFVARYFNLARVLVDQEKIYIPSEEEISEGQFIDGRIQSLNSSQVAGAVSAQSGKINVNSASAKELDTLPGVGSVTAEKIISGRPYVSVEELLTKKAVNKSTFEKIKELITVN